MLCRAEDLIEGDIRHIFLQTIQIVHFMKLEINVDSVLSIYTF